HGGGGAPCCRPSGPARPSRSAPLSSSHSPAPAGSAHERLVQGLGAAGEEAPPYVVEPRRLAAVVERGERVGHPRLPALAILGPRTCPAPISGAYPSRRGSTSGGARPSETHPSQYHPGRHGSLTPSRRASVRDARGPCYSSPRWAAPHL